MDIAFDVATRSTCIRRNYGAVLVKNGDIISTGYNGNVRGAEHCVDIGICQRELLKIDHGTRYELCEAIHAEQNAIINAARSGVSTIGSTLYVTGYPCIMCARFVVNAGIDKVFAYQGEDRYTEGLDFLNKNGVSVNVVS